MHRDQQLHPQTAGKLQSQALMISFCTLLVCSVNSDVSIQYSQSGHLVLALVQEAITIQQQLVFIPACFLTSHFTLIAVGGMTMK